MVSRSTALSSAAPSSWSTISGVANSWWTRVFAFASVIASCRSADAALSPAPARARLLLRCARGLLFLHGDGPVVVGVELVEARQRAGLIFLEADLAVLVGVERSDDLLRRGARLDRRSDGHELGLA